MGKVINLNSFFSLKSASWAVQEHQGGGTMTNNIPPP